MLDRERLAGLEGNGGEKGANPEEYRRRAKRIEEEKKERKEVERKRESRKEERKQAGWERREEGTRRERAQTQYLRTEPSDRSRFDFEGGNRFPIARGWSSGSGCSAAEHPAKLLPASACQGPPFPL